MTNDQFRKISGLLGGLRATQRMIHISYRTLQYYASGAKDVPDHVARLLRSALVTHSQNCLAAAQEILEPA